MDQNQRRADAEANLEVLRRAGYFQELMSTLGWVELMSLRRVWVDDALKSIRHMGTDEPQVLADAVRRWQLAADLRELEMNFIRDTLEAAKEIPGALTIEDALLMEKLQHEQPESTDRGPGAVTTGGY